MGASIYFSGFLARPCPYCRMYIARNTEIVFLIACLTILGSFIGGGNNHHTSASSFQTDVVTYDQPDDTTTDNIWSHDHTVLVTINGHTYRGTLTLISEQPQ